MCREFSNLKISMQGWSKKIQPKKADQKKPKKSTQNLTYPAGFFWLLLKNVSFINILVLFSLFTIIKPKILIYIANRSTQNTSKDLILALNYMSGLIYNQN